MKRLQKLLSLPLLAAALITLAPPVGAQEQYGTQNTLVSLPIIAWATGSPTNFAATTTQTKWGEFDLVITTGQADTAGAAGTLDLQWTTSTDGTAFVTGKAVPGASGWFSIPLTNTAAVITWRTNIALPTAGYWRMNYLTNASGKTLTNLVIKTVVKPMRYGGFGP